MKLTDLLVPTCRQLLQMVLRILDKAEVQLGSERADALLLARLAPDMFPLGTQLRFCAVQAQEGPMRLMGESLDRLEPVLNEGRNAGEEPGTLDEARSRLTEALAFLDELPPAALDQAPADASLELALPMGMTFDFTREQFARDWALSQFYFHVMTAYAILRKEGVEIGKIDFLPHLLPCVRQPSQA